MGFIKELFDKAENGTLNYEQFNQACKGANIKLANLANGEYVSKQKYDDDLKAKDSQISTLNDTITTRDTDLADIKKKLESAGADKEKLNTLTTSLADLQTRYDTDTKSYQEKISKQAYEFAVRDFANTKQFTSNAAKRDFINSMTAKNLSLENGKIMGAEDFVTVYSENNADAFVTENTEPQKPQPQFVDSTMPTPQDTNAVTKEQFAKMGYRSQLELYNNNRELYDKLTKE